MSEFTTIQKRPFARCSLVALIRAIASDGSREALDELLQYRPLFCFGKKEHLLLSEYLYVQWRERAKHPYGWATTLWDYALQLTCEKFSSLSCDSVKTGHAGDGNGKAVPEHEDCEDANDGQDTSRSSVDCRNYYRALVENIDNSRELGAASNAIQIEQRVARLFQRFVNRHVYLSYLEARRRANPFVSRYQWKYNGSNTITVWMPRYLAGNERKKWLENNVDPPVSTARSEQRRIQEIIDKKLLIPRYVPYCGDPEGRLHSRFPSPRTETERNMRPCFVEFVAREKAVAVDKQRPSIRKLGPARVEELVRLIFQNLASGTGREEDVARAFGLSKSTFSRFGGSQWHRQSDSGNAEVPDLWRNVAHLLSETDVFMDMAAEAGVLTAAREIVNDGRPTQLEGRPHE